MFSPEGKGIIVLMALSIFAIFLSGLFFGFSYFVLDTFHTKLQEINCDIPGSSYENCQAWFTDTIYNLFNLKGILIVFSYIFIFTLVLGMLIVGYNVGGKPVYMALYYIAVIVLTYSAIILSNLYRTLLETEIIYTIMQPFTIYNKVMLNFPWFVGFIGLISIGLSIVNYQRVKVNQPDPVSVLDY